MGQQGQEMKRGDRLRAPYRRSGLRVDMRRRCDLIGYVRVREADGSQVTDVQRDAVLAAGVAPAVQFLAWP